jgi:hypothetical protein
MKEEALNVLITVVINLFVLSMVSERLVNFLKLNFQKLYTWKLLPKDVKRFLKALFGNFRDKENTKKCEKLRERGVLNWAIFCSLIVAFASKADLFYLIRCGELPMDTYDKINKTGITLTALFISLGSKFWHDVLDILYFYKNAREKLSDTNIFNLDSADAVEEFVNLKNSNLIFLLKSQHSEHFKDDSNVLYTLFAPKRRQIKSLPLLVVHVKDKSKCNIPPTLTVQLPHSQSNIIVATQIVQDSIPVANTMLSDGDFAGIAADDFGGTICCALKSRTRQGTFLLTCSHVLTNGSSVGFGNFLPTNIQKDVVSIKRNDEEQEPFIIGKYCYSLRNFQFDIALIALDNSHTFSFLPTDIQKTSIELIEKDKLTRTIKMRGFVSDTIKTGTIVDFGSKQIPIKYAGDDIQKLENLITVSRHSAIGFNYQNSKPISQPGDSGSLIFDLAGHPIGMIIAASDLYSFAIPLPNILEELEMEIL